jgi:hypothetical protein
MMENLSPVLPAGFAAATLIALAGMKRELNAAIDLLEAYGGRLYPGRRFLPEALHPDFACRHAGRPTLVALIGDGCSYCHQGLQELRSLLIPSDINLCVAYLDHDGYPTWVHDLSLPNLIVAPISHAVIERLHTRIVPRWILLSRSNRVVLDQHGFVEGITSRQIGRELQRLLGRPLL